MRLLLDTTKSTTWETIQDGSYQNNTKLMNASAISLFVIVLLLICYYIYAKCFFRRQNLHIQRRINARLRSLTLTQSRLDPKLLEHIPMFVYSVRTRESPLEDCSICLSEFVEGDEGRVLPKCGHVFHVDCIDTWFKSRSSCPLCRIPVLPLDPVVPVIPPVTEAGSSSSSSDESGSSMVRFPAEASERKSIELAGLIVENPKEVEATRPVPVNA